jgi:hypothetical protein
MSFLKNMSKFVDTNKGANSDSLFKKLSERPSSNSQLSTPPTTFSSRLSSYLKFDDDSIINYAPPIIYSLFGIAQLLISFFTTAISFNHFIYLIMIILFTNFLKKLCNLGYTLLAWFFAILPLLFLFIKLLLVVLMIIGD